MIPENATPRSYDAMAVTIATGVETGDESLVQQHLKDEVDINNIVRRFGITPLMPSGPPGGAYGDFSGIEDYQSAVEAVERARSGFMALPPDVRERFGNDPGRIIDFARTVQEDEFARVLSGAPDEGSGGDAGQAVQMESASGAEAPPTS